MKKIIVFGGRGMVGSRFLTLQKDNFQINAPSASEVDILNKDQLLESIDKSEAEFVINLAAFTQVEKAEGERGNKEGLVYKLNAIGAKNAAEACKVLDKHLIHISTDYVFDGTKKISPYTEEDKQNPINWYGETKYLGEQFVLESNCKGVIVRISMPYSPFYQLKSDVARFFLDQLKNGNPITAIEDQKITPTLVDSIVNALKVLIEKSSVGLYHVSATDSVSPLEFAKNIAEVFKLNYSKISSVSFEEYNKLKKAKLLKYSWLNPTKFEKEFGGQILQTVKEDLTFFKKSVDEALSN